MSNSGSRETRSVVIVGAGFTGLSAAYELTQQGCEVTVLEKDDTIGGLAGSFDVGGEKLEKFYHHLFTSDVHIIGLVEELGLADNIIYNTTRTGMYYANNFYNLSNPLDVLKFKPLSLLNRIRLGMLVLKARRVNQWESLEEMTAREWLVKLAGQKVYDVVWEPLIRGKFCEYADDISAVYMWNKLKLRGGSRDKSSSESLVYFKGGFSSLVNAMAAQIQSLGGQILTNKRVDSLIVENGNICGVKCGGSGEIIPADTVLLTPALPVVAELLQGHVQDEYIDSINRIEYLANVCLVLELDRSLSDIYWLNVNDPDFPYVGVIEHTNMIPCEGYSGRHIVYLSKYLPKSESMYQMSKDELLNFSIPHIKRMFPEFEQSWILNHHVWKEPYTQPIVVCNYSKLIPDYKTPIENLWIANMAQTYPEDRGTNYAVRDGRKVAQIMIEDNNS